MPRRPRLDLPNVPQHVVQRGNDRRPCFFQPDDHAQYLRDLGEITRKLGCRVHAYVLMTNHAHLLLTPLAGGVVPRVMQSLGRRYVQYVNQRHHGTGTLWEGRYKSSLVDTEDYLLRCFRYIELNPVRARMVSDPREYPWSSHRRNAFGVPDALLCAHPVYRALGNDATERQQRYREFVMQAVNPGETDAIRLHLQRGYALRSSRFQQQIETQLHRRAGPAKIGRPRKSPPATTESGL